MVNPAAWAVTIVNPSDAAKLLNCALPYTSILVRSLAATAALMLESLSSLLLALRRGQRFPLASVRSTAQIGLSHHPRGRGRSLSLYTACQKTGWLGIVLAGVSPNSERFCQSDCSPSARIVHAFIMLVKVSATMA